MEAGQQPDAAQLAEQHKKDDLAAAAAVQGVDVSPGDTKVAIAEKLIAQIAGVSPAAGGPVPVVDDGVRDVEPNPAKVGDWVDILDGDYAGRHAAYLADAESNADGTPKTILVRTRDADNLVVDVPYASVRLSAYSGGR